MLSLNTDQKRDVAMPTTPRTKGVRDNVVPALDCVQQSLAMLTASAKQIPPGVFALVERSLRKATAHLESEVTRAITGRTT